jgi:hypothetical protein
MEKPNLWSVWILIGVCLVVLLCTYIPKLSVNNAKNFKSGTLRAFPEESSRVKPGAKRNLSSIPDFSATKDLISKILSLIYNRYEFHTTPGKQFLLTSNNMNKNAWDITKYKLAHKYVSGNQSFLMIFGGSSVTAGHDNYYNQSYPYIFKKRMADIFQSLGIELVVHNIAQGANNCVPYIHCYESMGGLDPDFIGWEQVTFLSTLNYFLFLKLVFYCFCSLITVEETTESLKPPLELLDGKNSRASLISLLPGLGSPRIVLILRMPFLIVQKNGHQLWRIFLNGL